MDNENVLRQMRAERFKRNNGKVMLAVNLLRHGYIGLPLVLSALQRNENLSEGEFLDSVHFLHGNGYIHLRKVAGQESVTDFADVNYKQLEAIITQDKGTRLLDEEISDKSIVLEW